MKFIRKKINEGYFKNPEEMKRVKDVRSKISNAEKLAKTSEKIVFESIERIMNDSLQRHESSNNETYRFVFSNLFFGPANDLFKIIYPNAAYAEFEKDTITYETKVIDRQFDENGNDNINIEIFVHIDSDHWLKHIKDRQEKDEKMPEDFYTRDILPSHDARSYRANTRCDFYDLISGLDLHSLYFMTTLKDTISYFYERWLTNFVFKNKDKYKDSPAGEFIDAAIGTWYGGSVNARELRLKIKKIHMFSEVQGDLAISTSLCCGSSMFAENNDEETKKKFEELMKFISFENSGDVILRDDYLRRPEMRFKKNGIVNEGYFKNPEDKKKEIENRKNSSKAELLAKTANDLVIRRMEQIIDDYLNDKKYYYNENMFLNFRTIGLPKFTEIFYISMGDYNSKPFEAKNECPLCRFKSKVSIDEENKRIDVEIYSFIQWNFLFEEIKLNQQDRDNGVVYPECIDVRSNIETYGFYNDYYKNSSSIIRTSFVNRLKEELCNQIEKPSVKANKELYDLIMMMFERNVCLRSIHMFEGIDTDVVVNLENYHSINETIQHKNAIEELAKVFSFENSGDVIFVGQNKRGFHELPKIVVQKDKVFLR